MTGKEIVQQKDSQILRLQKEVEKLKKSIKTQKYGVIWADVPEAFEDDIENKLPVLEEVPKLAIKSEDDKPTHIMIEGDNYHALTCLNYTHKGKVDVIYIDPPYNTGSDGFRYKDKRILDKFPDGTEVPKDHPFRHSYWLSFMKKRLELAKDLLNKSGVIFVSIDDNEFAQLKLLMDEVFDNNFIGMFIHKNNSTKNQSNLLSVSTEYMLLYSKSVDGLKGQKWRVQKKGARDVSKMFTKLKDKGLSLEEIEVQIKDMYTRPKYSHLSRWNKVDADGVFKDADLSREGGSKDYTIINPETNEPCVVPARGWGKSYEELLRLQKENLIWYGDQSTPPGMKDYITDEDKMVPDNFLYFDNSVDTRMIKDMFGKLVFENPKPVGMIKMIIDMVGKKNATVLDFFGGSGTTGHAVLELNAEDEGSRQFILVTNNENEIATQVCRPRLEKVINGFKKYKPLGNSLKYYKTNFVGRHNILDADDKDKLQLAYHAGEMLSIAENTLDLKEKTDYWQIFESKNKYTAVYFKEEYNDLENFIKNVKKLDKPVSVYVFSWEDDPMIEDFEDNGNITVKTIPQPILEIYKQIYNLI